MNQYLVQQIAKEHNGFVFNPFPLSPMGSCTSSPKGIAALGLRLSFGLSLLFVGLAHYMSLEMFKGMVSDGLGPLTGLGVLWAYILPALQIVGGALYALGKNLDTAAWTAGIALGSIPVGMTLKPLLSGTPLPDVMPLAINAFIWLIVYALVVKTSSCCEGK